MQRIIRLAAMLFLFVALPLTSWYYLKTGAQWRRENLNELKQLGQVLPIMYTDGAGRAHNLIDKNVCVIMVSGASDGQPTVADQLVLDTLAKIYDQFNAREELRLVVVSPDKLLAPLVVTKEGGSTSTWLQTDAVTDWSALQKSVVQGYMPGHSGDLNTLVMLSDINGSVRSVYDVTKQEQVKKLVNHLAILLPLK